MKNAIIGFAFNYSNEQIAPFLNSLNRTGFTGDLILYINNKSRIEKTSCFKYNFILVNFEDDHRGLIQKHRALKLLSKPVFDLVRKPRANYADDVLNKQVPFTEDFLSWCYVNYYLATMRFVLYYNLLVSNKYANVFFSDISDVIFQSDIFKNVVPGKILAFEEKKDVMLGQDPWNSEWVIETTGVSAFEAIKSKNIYCSGTILSDYNTAITFLKDYIRLMLSKDFKRKIVGLDQGFYNYMISYQQKEYFQKSENGEVIFTVALNTVDEFTIESNKISYKEKKQIIPAVVHQYTRHPSIKAYVNELYKN